MSVSEAIWQYGAIQYEPELAGFAEVVRRLKPQRVVELGTEFGGTLWLWCQYATDDAQIAVVDIDFTNLNERGPYPYPVRPGQQQLRVEANSGSTDTFDQVAAWMGGPVDFLFIDANHEPGPVTRDWELWHPLVRPGGIIGFHDVSPQRGPLCGVSKLWSKLRSEGYRMDEWIRDRPENPMGLGVVYL